MVMRLKTVESVKNHHGDEKDEPLEGDTLWVSMNASIPGSAIVHPWRCLHHLNFILGQMHMVNY